METLGDMVRDGKLLELEARIKKLEDRVSRIKIDALIQPLPGVAYTPIGFKKGKIR